jgi:hypothetical protein
MYGNMRAGKSFTSNLLQKETELLNKLFKLAENNNLEFDYFQHERFIKFKFNHKVCCVVSYNILLDKSTVEIINTIKYLLCHDFKLIKKED